MKGLIIMSENKPTPEQIQALIEYASKKLGVTPEQIADTVEGDLAQMVKSRLSEADIARFQAMVSDKDKLEKMLKSPQAKQLVDKLLNKN